MGGEGGEGGASILSHLPRFKNLGSMLPLRFPLLFWILSGCKTSVDNPSVRMPFPITEGEMQLPRGEPPVYLVGTLRGKIMTPVGDGG